MPARIAAKKKRRQQDSDDDEEDERDFGHQTGRGGRGRENEDEDEEEEEEDMTPKKRVKVEDRNGAMGTNMVKVEGRRTASSSVIQIDGVGEDEHGGAEAPGVKPESGPNGIYQKVEGEETEGGQEGQSQVMPNGVNHDDEELQEEELIDEDDIDLDDIEQGNPEKQKHAPGAIVRVKLLNFVTYTQVEFHPGPSLNMVIGPNGTGKSTLVCAICLGLGWGPNHLGRAKEVSEFVKHGCPKATIEIELQGRPGVRNPVITRTIFRENNQTAYTLNGKQATHKQIQQEVASYRIQIDNLCQFLPQERVCEFAALDPVNLLRETQRAAAAPEVLKWHELLITISKEQKTRKIQLDADNAQLQNLEGRQRALEPDVARLRERKEVLREIELHKKAKPYARYRISRELALAAKTKYRHAQTELADLREEQEPAMRRVDQKREYAGKVKKALQEKQKQVEDKTKQLQNFKRRKLDEKEEKIKELRTELGAVWRKEKDRKGDEARIKNRISKLKEEYRRQPPEPDITGFNNRLREKSEQITELRRKAEDLAAEVNPRTAMARRKKEEITQAEEELARLHSQAGRLEEALQRQSPDTAKAWKWIRQNRDKFEKEVFGPPMLECKVKDSRYKDMLEHLIRRGNLLAITCQSPQDYKTLSAAFFGSRSTGEKGLGLGDVTINNYSGTNAPTLEYQKSPYSTEELKQRFGMDGWALNFIEGPEPILNMLCHEARLHVTPVTLRKLNDNQVAQLEENFVSYATDRLSYQVIWRREYGPDAKVVRVAKIYTARILVDQQVDQSLTASLQNRIRNLKMEVHEIEEANKEAIDVRRGLKEDLDKLTKEKNEILREKEKQQEAVRRWQKLGSDIEQEEEKLAQKMMENYKNEAELLEKQLTSLAIERAEDALQFAGQVNGLVELQNELLRLQLWDLEAQSDVEILEFRNQTVVQQLRDKETEVNQAKEEADRARREALRDQKAVQDAQAESPLNEEDTAYITKINERNLTLDELDNEIEAIQGRLALLHEGNPNAIREFEKRQKDIEHLKKKIEEEETELAKYTRALNNVKSKWEPALEKVVESISKAFGESFERIGCAGEVKVHKTEDFEKWEIQILVKFRENESLQILTNQRQSGGERAVSTIFYLMALQSLAQAPFRVVDEINQGMDPRNERMVHHRMVSIACQKHTSQYFLITPKLLTNLKYHPRMKVHTINSGDWVEPGFSLDVMKYVKKAKDAKAKGIAIL